MDRKHYNHDITDFLPLISLYNRENHQHFTQFKQDIQNGKHPIIDVLKDETVLQDIEVFQKHFSQNFKSLIILGTGGSSLGARAIAQWFGYQHNPLLNECDFNFYASDNLDDLSFARLLNKIDLDTAHFLIISKSGNTVETNVQLQTLFKKFESENKLPLIAKLMTVITEVKAYKNNLHKIADTYNIPVFKHSLIIGGRYSVLTMTGLLPTSLMRFDYKGILKGAQSVVDELLTAKTLEESEPCHGSAALIAAEEKGFLTHIFAAYGDRFSDFSNWIRQLWAESLGKSAKGGLFVPSINPLDQHSQLQMYYDGIDNKTYSFIKCTLKNTQQTYLNFDTDSQFSYLNGKTIHDVVRASYHGTIESLRSKGRLIRTFLIHDYSAETLGALMMHFMIETVFASYLLGINPYDQPAVEDYKKRTKAILQS